MREKETERERKREKDTYKNWSNRLHKSKCNCLYSRWKLTTSIHSLTFSHTHSRTNNAHNEATCSVSPQNTHSPSPSLSPFSFTCTFLIWPLLCLCFIWNIITLYVYYAPGDKRLDPLTHNCERELFLWNTSLSPLRSRRRLLNDSLKVYKVNCDEIQWEHCHMCFCVSVTHWNSDTQRVSEWEGERERNYQNEKKRRFLPFQSQFCWKFFYSASETASAT